MKNNEYNFTLSSILITILVALGWAALVCVGVLGALAVLAQPIFILGSMFGVM